MILYEEILDAIHELEVTHDRRPDSVNMTLAELDMLREIYALPEWPDAAGGKIFGIPVVIVDIKRVNT